MTTVAEVMERYQDFLAELAALPATEKEKRYNDLLATFPRDARHLVGIIVATSDSVLPRNTKTINATNYAEGNMSNTEKNQYNQTISGGTFHAPVGVNQTFTDCYKVAQGVQRDELKEILKTVITQVETLQPQLNGENQKLVERKLKLLTDEASQEKPDTEMLALSGKGLIEAASTVAGMAGPITTTIQALLALFS